MPLIGSARVHAFRSHTGIVDSYLFLREDALKRYWNHIDSHKEYEDRIVGVRHDKYHFLPNDIIKDYTVFEFEDWVNIIPVTRDGDIVMIRQWRHGVQKETLEIPGGLISHDDIGHAEAAIREMTEETGYYSDNVIHIGTVEPNPAIQTNRCYTYLATDAFLRTHQNLDPTEAIRVELIKKEQLYGMIKAGEITHGLVVAAFAFLMLHEKGKWDNN
ncbi:MAG TPA: NUDIX hydrolase [Deltaproteobacteria bacterium]|nr:NUDIX hydrolase [Deltaproteobacteria bacterium]